MSSDDGEDYQRPTPPYERPVPGEALAHGVVAASDRHVLMPAGTAIAEGAGGPVPPE